MRTEYLVIGSGLTGAVIARTLADAGREVLVVERRNHCGGNVHDHIHPSGIRIHTYGPHYFRTNSEELWAFVNRFAAFYQYEASLKTLVDGKYENWPIAGSYIRRTIGTTWSSPFKGTPANFQEASLAMMPELVYDKFVKGYSEKQWGVPASTLATELARRFDVREDDEPRLMRHKRQGIPIQGYAALMTSMLAGIPVVVGCDYLKHRKGFSHRKSIVFTGPIDEFFGFDLGRLKYRGQQRRHHYHPDADYLLPCGQVNNPDPSRGPHIRTLEWKHMMQATYSSRIKGTVLTEETTFSPEDPNCYEYPFPDTANAVLYARYRERAAALGDVLICGRLGEYRYYDMDQAIGRAQVLAKLMLAEKDPGTILSRTFVTARPSNGAIAKEKGGPRAGYGDERTNGLMTTIPSTEDRIEASSSVPELFIGIPAYERSEHLDRTMKALADSTTGSFKLVVQVARQSVVKNKMALLALARQSGARYIAFCDDDVEPEHGWNQKLIVGLEEASRTTGRRLGQTSPRIVYPDGRIFCLWIDVFFDPKGHRHEVAATGAGLLDSETYRSTAFVGALPGTLTIFTRTFLDEIGWTFDERYERSQIEDVDQSLQCRAAGFGLLYNGTVKVIHHTKGLSPRSAEENFEKLYSKWGGRTDLTLVIPPTRVALAAAGELGADRQGESRLRYAWALVGRNPIRRIASGIRVWRSHGLKGVKAHCTQIWFNSLKDR